MKRLLPTLCISLCVSVAHAETRYVCASGTCPSPRYWTIQSAIDASSDGDVIEIAAGNYFPLAVITIFNKTITIRGETDASGQPLTVISGWDVAPAEEFFSEGGVIHCSGIVGADTVLENLIIRDGDAHRGGGMYCMAGPTLRNCHFINNQGASGGGVYFSDWGMYSTPVFENCTFVDNRAMSLDGYGGAGGAVLLSGEDGNGPTFYECQFTGNTAEHQGGGVWIGRSEGTFKSCLFSDNEAGESGGGLWYYGTVWQPVLVMHCVFERNTASQGGGIFAKSGINGIFLYVHDSDVNLNRAMLEGGGMYISHYEEDLGHIFAHVIDIELSRFVENEAGTTGGGIHCDNYASPTIKQCTIKKNTAMAGGGLDSHSTSLPSVEDTLFCGNATPQRQGPWLDLGGNSFEDFCATDCPADITRDGYVDVHDFSVLLVHFGHEGVSPADINGDLMVDVQDFTYLLINWGNPCN
ncbi:MAG: right-handed parallel beta-helix repeat-containing protein [Phycisphaerales bacterium]|nr:right-handed parallel beta-helix repeat-containing protein [Phycisphaerales bacterium]